MGEDTLDGPFMPAAYARSVHDELLSITKKVADNLDKTSVEIKASFPETITLLEQLGNSFMDFPAAGDVRILAQTPKPTSRWVAREERHGTLGW